MHLEFQKLLTDTPGFQKHLDQLPGRVFSGKEHPKPDTKALFFCYALPAEDKTQRGAGVSSAGSTGVPPGDAPSGPPKSAKPGGISTTCHRQNPGTTGRNRRLHPQHAGTPRRVTLPQADLHDVRLRVENTSRTPT